MSKEPFGKMDESKDKLIESATKDIMQHITFENKLREIQKKQDLILNKIRDIIFVSALEFGLIVVLLMYIFGLYAGVI